MASLAEIQQLVQQIRDELPSLLQRSQIIPQQVVVGEGLSDISERLGLIQAGEFRTGNGLEPGRGFSGVRMGYPPFSYEGTLWNVVGVNNDTLEFGLRAEDGRAVFGGGNVVLGSSGIDILGDGSSWINFYNADGTVILFTMSVDTVTGEFQFQSLLPGDSVMFVVKLTENSTPYYIFSEDEEQTNRTLFEIQGGTHGGRFILVSDGFTRIDMRAGDDTDDPTFVRLYTSDAATPPAPYQYWEVNYYLRNNKFVIQYDDAGTVRYKYLDLSGTGVTWQHSTTAP